MMRRISVLIVLSLASCGDDSVGAPPDAAPLPPGVKVSGQIVRAPGQPVPIADVTVSVINPIEDPDHLISAKTDDHGIFVLDDVHPTPGGRVRLFIDGTTGGGGPFVVMNSEFPVDGTKDVNVGVIHLVPMDPAGIVRITDDNAVIMHMIDGRDYAVLRNDVTVSAGVVTSDVNVSATRSAQLTVPKGTLLVFPYASPLLVNVTRVDLSAIPAPLPRAADGPRYTQYFVTLQPSGLELRNMANGTSQAIGLQLPEVDPWPPPGPDGQPVEFWEVQDPLNEEFKKVVMGTVTVIPGVGTMAVSDMPFVTRFGWYAATPPCPSGITQVHGRVVDSNMQPIVGAQMRTQGVRVQSGNDGTFTIANVPLGCLMGGAGPNLEVLGSLQRNDGTFVSGTSGSKPSVPDGTTEVGDILLTTPLYIVRAQPDSAIGVALDSPFDVFFSEDIDPTTINPGGSTFFSVSVQQVSVGPGKGGPCTTSHFAIPGVALLDAADAKHVQVIPTRPLTPGQTYAGFVDSTTIKAVSGHTLPTDFLTPFSTLDTTGPNPTLQQPADRIALIANATVNFTGIASDSVGIARAKFQIFDSNANGAMGSMRSEFPAAIINLDPCVPNRSVQLRANAPLPPDMGYYIVRLLVYDSSGNPGQNDHLITIAPPGDAFPFCGQAVTTAFVSSNGYITFDSGDNTYDPSIQQFFSHSRVSAFYTDMDFDPVGSNGTVFWNVDTSDPSDPAFVVTWFGGGMFPSTPSHGATHDPACGGTGQPACNNCGPNSGQPYCCGQPTDTTPDCHAGANTYQIALFKSGAIQIAYDDVGDVRATTSGGQTEDMFMGVSCPGTPLTPAPAPTALLTVQAQPAAMNEARDVAWSGEPIYDFLSRTNPLTPAPPNPGSTLASTLFQTRYFNFLPPGAATKPFMPIFQGGHVIQSILTDDASQAVPITFTAQPPIDGGASDGGVITPDASTGVDAGPSACSQVTVQMIAGNGTAGFVDGAGGPTGPAEFNGPTGVDVDSVNSIIYVADRGNHRIRQINAAATVGTLAGNGTGGYFDGSTGPTGTSMFLFPRSVGFRSGQVMVADQGNNRIRNVLLGQLVVGTLAGNGQMSPFVDGTLGPTGTTTFFSPGGVKFDAPTGAVLVADTNNHRIRSISTSTTTVAGTGTAGYLDMPALQSLFNMPFDVAVDPATGDIYVADAQNFRIRKISAGNVTTLAGSGSGAGQDGTGGPTGTAAFQNPLSLAVGKFQGASVLYVADGNAGAIRMVSLPTGNTTTIAGAIDLNGYVDAVAGCQARFNNPSGIVFDPGPAAAPRPLVIVADTGNNRIRGIGVP